MIDIVKFAIDSGDAFLCFTPIAPQLGHIYFTCFILPPRIPRNHLFAFITQVRHHFGYKLRIAKNYFISAYVNIRNIKIFDYLIQ